MFSNIFHFHPYLGKIPILTNIFQRGWNYQLDTHFGCLFWGEALTTNDNQPNGPRQALEIQANDQKTRSKKSGELEVSKVEVYGSLKMGKPTMNEDGFSYWKWRIFQCYGSFPGWYVKGWHVVDFRKGSINSHCFRMEVNPKIWRFYPPKWMGLKKKETQTLWTNGWFWGYHYFWKHP